MSIKLKLVVLALVIMFTYALTTSNVNAHPGRTDSNGGHNCYVGSCAGTYHYHNGGGSYTPPTPSYYEQGLMNGKAHATREADNIRSKSRESGYHSGYSSGISGTQRLYYSTHPVTICDTSFTFDTGTSEAYKSTYDLGWHNICNMYAREVYQDSYDKGYVAGYTAKTEKAEVLSDSDTSETLASDWLGWGVLGLFVGVPVIGAIVSGAKEWWDKL